MTRAAAAPAPPLWRRVRAHRRWPWLKRGAAIAFLLLVATLVVLEARKVQWHQVLATLRAMPGASLLVALALAACSHLLYSCFDLLGRRYTGHRLRARTVMAVTFVSYAFNLNMGTLIGGAGIRFRLYLQMGLPLDAVARVLTLSMITNWLGYLLLAGIVVMLQPTELPLRGLRDAGVHWVAGGALLLVPLAYVVACAGSRRRVVQVRGHRLHLPSFPLALSQVALSSVNWLVMAAVIWTLLGGRLEYPAVLCALLAAAVAGVVSHVPAGLGVLEAVFVTLLSDRMPKEALLAALLAYRALYYLLPLAVAIAMYFAFEARLKRERFAS
jgi:uncharacterized membrane protein YbhN (UPF0104 family)